MECCNESGRTVFNVLVDLWATHYRNGKVQSASFHACINYEDGSREEIYNLLLLRQGKSWKMLLPPQCITLPGGFRFRIPGWLPYPLYERVRREAARVVEIGEGR